MRLLTEIALLVLAGIAVAFLIARLPPPRPIRRQSARPPEPPRPEQLRKLERLVVTAGTSTTHAHAYLRPVLIEITADRLAKHGQRLDRMPEAVGRELLGDGLWDLVRPDRPFPRDRHGSAVPVGELSAMLEVLDRL